LALLLAKLCAEPLLERFDPWCLGQVFGGDASSRVCFEEGDEAEVQQRQSHLEQQAERWYPISDEHGHAVDEDRRSSGHGP